MTQPSTPPGLALGGAFSRCAVLERALHEALETLAELRDSPGRSRLEWEEARNGFTRLASIARDLGLDSDHIEEAA